MAYLIDSLTDSKQSIGMGRYVLRPINRKTVLERMCDAWGVLTKKYDAVRYMTEAEYTKNTQVHHNIFL